MHCWGRAAHCAGDASLSEIEKASGQHDNSLPAWLSVLHFFTAIPNRCLQALPQWGPSNNRPWSQKQAHKHLSGSPYPDTKSSIPVVNPRDYSNQEFVTRQLFEMQNCQYMAGHFFFPPLVFLWGCFSLECPDLYLAYGCVWGRTGLRKGSPPGSDLSGTRLGGAVPKRM